MNLLCIVLAMIFFVVMVAAIAAFIWLCRTPGFTQPLLADNIRLRIVGEIV